GCCHQWMRFKPAYDCIHHQLRASGASTAAQRARRTHRVAASSADLTEDLLQFPDRLKWYESKFCADTMPDWNAARQADLGRHSWLPSSTPHRSAGILADRTASAAHSSPLYSPGPAASSCQLQPAMRLQPPAPDALQPPAPLTQPRGSPRLLLAVRDVAPGLRELALEVEISRERVPLRNAYRGVGQRASLRVVGNLDRQLTGHPLTAPPLLPPPPHLDAVSSPPFPQELNRTPLFLVRGDLFANEVKAVREPESVMAELTVLVGQREAPELWALEVGDDCPPLELGPFLGEGLGLKGTGIMAIFRYPKVLLFVQGRGIATARALLECSHDVPGISCHLRQEVKAYYKVKNDADIVYKERFPAWSEAAATPSGCKLSVVTHTGTFGRAFDDDDELLYDPDTTAAVILTGGDPEAEAEAREVCAEAEIRCIVVDSQEAASVVHHDSTPKNFRRWVTDRA
ncbi:hypothetical protein QJQ45_023373, partial [Haematococcus lacustris]